jgi:N-formylglutamate amidohydrolase
MDTHVPLPWHIVHSPDKAWERIAPLKPSRVVFSFPHSGRYYPDSFIEQARPKGIRLRQSEDAYIDDMAGFGPAMPVHGLRTHYPRAFIDVNRNPLELDRRLIRGELPKGALSQSSRVRAGYGVVARCLSAEDDIYSVPLDMDEVQRRIDLIHTPYHQTLTRMLADARRVNGCALLIDCHSMPSASVTGLNGEGKVPDVVLGTLHGESCSAALVRKVRERFETAGLTVAMNKPFAGGYILEQYGRPAQGIEAVQIEINRALYMEEATLERHEGFARLSALFKALSDDLNHL